MIHEQVPSDLGQNHSVKKHKEYKGWCIVEAVRRRASRVIAEKETDLKGKMLFRPRWITIELLANVKGMDVILHGLHPVPVNR
jgi:hypothetical protein